MKVLIAYAFFSAASVLLGLVICGILLRLKKRKASAIAALIFFAGPVVTYITLYVRDEIEKEKFRKDALYVAELCRSYGGEKIYKTVDNVEGVFQMIAPTSDVHRSISDQYGMVSPWGHAVGDASKMTYLLSYKGNGYLFIEQQPEFGKEGPPYRLTYLKQTGKKIGDRYPTSAYKDEPEVKVVEKKVNELRSRYGYFIEDLSTREMRSRWIAGGRIKIIDLKTNELLAERTGFFRAVGMQAEDHWVNSSTVCPNQIGLPSFLTSVLKPITKQSSSQFPEF